MGTCRLIFMYEQAPRISIFSSIFITVFLFPIDFFSEFVDTRDKIHGARQNKDSMRRREFNNRKQPIMNNCARKINFEHNRLADTANQ